MRSVKKYFDYLKTNSKEKEASLKRVEFLKQYLIHKNTKSYKTQVERDWSYIALREYNYFVLLQSFFIAGTYAFGFSTAATIYTKKFNPLFLIVGIPIYFY